MNLSHRTHIPAGARAGLLSALALLFVGFVTNATAQDAPTAPRIPGHTAVGAPPNPKVDVAWNRFYDADGLNEILRRLAAEHPGLTRLTEIGRSHEGRPLLLLEVTNFATGAPEDKPAMWIDGNIHGNEVQAGETVAYTAWLLCEQYGRVDKLTELLDRRAFYLLPSINPDGRDDWFHSIHSAHTPHSSRTSKVPLDNDRDGLVDEDDADDLDGDGFITQMRIRSPNGRYKSHPEFPDLMIDVGRDEVGEFDMLGWEGIDNDGDGEINEDGTGGYDPNRNWAWDWQPQHVQWGAHDYPFSLPENRAAAEFVIAHPNIMTAQSYHNAAGMMLRSPGRKGGEVQHEDELVTRHIGERGEFMIPFYDSLVIWKDLYTVWGGEIDWFYGARGIITFTNELWTSENYTRTNSSVSWGPGSVDFTKTKRQFARDLLFEEPIRPWTEFEHPKYGTIEIGGYTRHYGRVPPSFMLEEELHRNAAFTIYHADQMPIVEWGEVTVSDAPGGLRRVDVELRNHRIIPTRTGQQRKYGITPPDTLTVSSADGAVEARDLVVAAGMRDDRFDRGFEPVATRPWRLEIDRIPGMGARYATFLVSGDAPITLTFRTATGTLTRTVGAADAD